MSFRWFIYYSALCGGCAAFIGWMFGRILVKGESVLATGVEGLFLGLFVAVVLTLIDNLWNGARGIIGLLLRLIVATAIGALGGFLGGLIGQLLFDLLKGVGQIIGWTFTGVLVGASVGFFDFLERMLRKKPTAGAKRKVINGIIGGSVGGLLGSFLFRFAQLLGKSDHLWTPGALGFIALGILIGLMVGLVQVILKEAWIKVEEGFRAGRELILSAAEVTIGRAESCTIGLFGDPRVEKLHAKIIQQGDSYVLEDMVTEHGTFLNNERVNGSAPLKSGDLIRIGRNILRFSERAKKPAH